MRVLIACGGTGGHIFPGVSLYHALKKKSQATEVLLALDRRAISAQIIPEEIPHVFISLAPLRFKLDLQSVLFVLKLSKGIYQSLKIILRFKPDAVVGFGGYASFFLVFFAWIFRAKTVIHEQNVTPGLANAILAYLADKIAIGFPKTKNYLGVNASKARLTGSPLRPGLSRMEDLSVYNSLGLSPDKFTILVMGGSQGAHKINATLACAAGLLENKSDFEFIHLCGSKDCLFLERAYQDSGIQAKVFSFFKSMEYLYSVADLVISRAGAASINEIAFFGLSSILIPYPFAFRHQGKNAAYLHENNAAFMIEEKNLSPEIIRDKILELFNNPALRESMSRNILMHSLPRADEALADLVLNG